MKAKNASDGLADIYFDEIPIFDDFPKYLTVWMGMSKYAQILLSNSNNL